MAAGGLADQLTEHLGGLTVPYLFVGAGLSIRYTGAESWPALLRLFAEPLSKPYEYYASTADGDLPRLATLLANDFHEMWWSDPRYEESRAANAELIVARDSALKVEISAHLAKAVDRLPTEGELAKEIELLKAAVIDGIITTNFDPVLEHVRPDLHPYVGQDELLFSDPQGIGEIYKIHGSFEQPNSLVLTAEDYARFDERNPYLAAKLLTIFVEHPVIFLGYSLTDRNVQRVLVDIARCLTDDRIQDLRDRLLFVEWKPGATPAMASTVISAEGFAIPVQSIVVPDFREVFTALGTVKRRIPARLLRHLRKEIYELVKTSEPTARAYVEELEPSADPSSVEVYAGIGAIAKLTTSYVGLNRADLLDDVLDDRGYDPSRVVLEALPNPRLGSKTTMLPVYKYLRGADLLHADGRVADEAQLPPRVVDRVEARETLLKGLGSYRQRAERNLKGVASFAALVEACSADDVLYYLPFLDEDVIELDGLRNFLVANRESFDTDRQPVSSQWAKAVCLYDWLRYGRGL
ncbi:SIR2 family protein [Conexibacter woesei]|uniref:SIR2 family protein n=1 Tax=Conexibacter woesei TaxID=191495 RepID=UPI000686559B|nr:SIR2 family protein [Conexibacter woesei]